MLMKEIMPLLKIHGRTVYDEEKEALYCNWSCSGFSVGVKGSYLKAHILADSDQIPGMPNMPTPPPDWPCVGLVINDELVFRQECRENDQWVTLWENEGTVEQEVRVLKLSENARGKMAFAQPLCLFAFFFPLGMVVLPVSCTVSRTSVHSSSGTLSDLVP